MQEALVAAAEEGGFSYVIVRPGRLIGGPWTNADIAGLLKLESSGGMGGSKVEAGDELVGDASRDRVAKACIMALVNAVAADIDFAVVDDDDALPFSRDEWGRRLGSLAGLET